MDEIPSDSELKYGLTPLQVKMLLDSVRKLHVPKEILGAELFAIFLSDYPQHARYFKFESQVKSFQTVNNIRQHGSRVARDTIRILDTCLRNEAVSKTIITTNAHSHQKRRISAKAYDDLRETFIKVIGRALGPENATEELLDNWDKVLRNIFGIILSSRL